jgi:hypothetical protein
MIGAQNLSTFVFDLPSAWKVRDMADDGLPILFFMLSLHGIDY